jgi:hypothetical protein
VPYLRLTADRRGVEHTFLLHVPAPGQPARVLYWYRTAPELRIGRPALDDAAMRALEEQYPDIDFDWPYILEMGTMTPVEVEPQLPPRRRKLRPAEPEADIDAAPVESGDREPRPAAPSTAVSEADDTEPDLLGELLGRGIATSLRGQHAELARLIDASPADAASQASWRVQLAALDPDGWESPEAVLAGMATFETDVAALRAAVDAAAPN